MTGVRTVHVAVLSPVDTLFTYGVPQDWPMPPVGAWVSVPFGRRQAYGVIWAHGAPQNGADGSLVSHVSLTKADHGVMPPLKELTTVLDGPVFSPAFRDFLDWVRTYTLAPWGQVLKLAGPLMEAYQPKPNGRKIRSEILSPPDPDHQSIVLSPEQEQAAAHLKAKVNAGFSVTLLDGVTGSGKTEVYGEAIGQCLKSGGQCLVLLPEIALTHQVLDRMATRFGSPPLMWHSSLTPAQRRGVLHHLQSAKPLIIVGARSALFLPYPTLGLIVVDEEHDGAYKQEEGVRYHGRDCAVMRGFQEKIPVVLASATPSLESYHNAEIGKYDHVTLTRRHGQAQLPSVELLDRRTHQNKGKGSIPSSMPVAGSEGRAATSPWIDPLLHGKITDVLKDGDQVLLYLNRRGYAPLTLCRGCGHRLECPHCSAYLIHHKKSHRFCCHQCGYTKKGSTQCPQCQAPDCLIPCGPGVERLSEDVARLFPKARQLILSSDTLTTPRAIEEAMTAIRDRTVDILIGTQMIAKGHHFPHITLVGVIDGDLGLSGGDLRATEKTYHMLHQVAGRCGRGDRPGGVVIQTYCPHHPVMLALASGDRDTFYGEEKARRSILGMPPFGALAALIVTSHREQDAAHWARRIADILPDRPDVTKWGPAPAPLSLLRGRYRFRVLLKAPQKGLLSRYLRIHLKGCKIPSSVRLSIDMDPHTFL